jgi:hypothetical protein
MVSWFVALLSLSYRHQAGHPVRLEADDPRRSTMSNLLNRSLGIGAAAIVFAALAFGGVSAEEKKKATEPKVAACKTMTAEADCTGRNDCSWVHASVDKKTGKEKRKAYCRTKPKSKKA